MKKEISEASPEGELAEETIEKAKKAPQREKPPTEPRPGYFKFQTEIMEHHDKKWNEMMKKLKKDIEKVIHGTN